MAGGGEGAAGGGGGAVRNVNVGVLGHVDSGKTSLVRSLSELLSTAALDKHPQSKERGITLDLGFSALRVSAAAGDGAAGPGGDETVQLTLVDCPGHASLLRTIIGGANIIDMMILVVDAVKGMQTQTAECLVVGELLTDKMVVVLNKVDLLPPDARDAKIARTRKRVENTLASTRFAGAPVVAVSACPGAAPGAEPVGVRSVVEELMRFVPGVARDYGGSFLFSVDHCFPIKGKGTVLTGTVLRGAVSVNDTVELPEQRIERKVKSMQMFHRPVDSARCGDRLGLCVTQLDAKLLERGLVAAPGTLQPISAAVACVEKVRFFRGDIQSKSKLNVIVGHMQSHAQMVFFRSAGAAAPRSVREGAAAFALGDEYLYSERLHAAAAATASAARRGAPDAEGGAGEGDVEAPAAGAQYCLLEFDQPLLCSEDSVLIGVKLDTDAHTNACRIGFHGRIALPLAVGGAPADLGALRVYKVKRREGVVERVQDGGRTAICKGMFKKETDINIFTGLRVTASTGACGTIEGAFGKSGKFKVYFPDGLVPEGGGEGASTAKADGAGARITLECKRFLYDKEKRLRQ